LSFGLCDDDAGKLRGLRGQGAAPSVDGVRPGCVEDKVCNGGGRLSRTREKMPLLKDLDIGYCCGLDE
jgi:hypothetical protein